MGLVIPVPPRLALLMALPVRQKSFVYGRFYLFTEIKLEFRGLSPF